MILKEAVEKSAYSVECKAFMLQVVLEIRELKSVSKDPLVKKMSFDKFFYYKS